MTTDRQIPTLRQFEALKYVYFMELTYSEAGVRMGISQQAVSRLIERLGKIAPELEALCGEITKKPTRKFLTYIDSDSDSIDEFF